MNFRVEEKWSLSFEQPVNQNNIFSIRFKEYWQRSEYVSFPDLVFARPKTRSVKRRAHYKLNVLFPKAVIEHDENKINKPNLCVTEYLYQPTTMVNQLNEEVLCINPAGSTVAERFFSE